MLITFVKIEIFSARPPVATTVGFSPHSS